MSKRSVSSDYSTRLQGQLGSFVHWLKQLMASFRKPLDLWCMKVPTSLIAIGLVPSLNWKSTMWVVDGATGGRFGASASVNHTMGFKFDLRIAVKETKISASTKRPVARFGKIMVVGSGTCDADDAPRRRFGCADMKTSNRQAGCLTISEILD
jgi:hypothetical protein